MYWLLFVLSIATALLYSLRAGHVYDEQRVPERAATAAISLLLTGGAVAFFERARTGGETEWFHWVLLSVLALSTAAYGWLHWTEVKAKRRSRHVLNQTHDEIVRWLGEVEHFEPCHNQDCERVRAEMRNLAVDLRPILTR